MVSRILAFMVFTCPQGASAIEEPIVITEFVSAAATRCMIGFAVVNG